MGEGKPEIPQEVLVGMAVREHFENDFRNLPDVLLGSRDESISLTNQNKIGLKRIYVSGCYGWFIDPENQYGNASNPYHRRAYGDGWRAMNEVGRRLGIER